MDDEHKKHIRSRERAKDTVALEKVYELLTDERSKLSDILEQAADFHESLKEI